VDLLVVGGSGFLGRELAGRAQLAGHRVTATFLTAAAGVPGVRWLGLDLCRSADVLDLVARTAPQVVINAAYRQSDWAATADGAANVVMAAAAAIARTSLIVGDGRSVHEKTVHALIDGSRTGVLFTDDMRCPVHVSDLSLALLELAAGRSAGMHHVAGADAISRYELGRLIAHRDGLDGSALKAGRRADTDLTGPVDVRLDSTATQRQLTTRLRGAREFLA
jgi:dTDP-4-dehydrorhamnose reductase